MSNATSIFAAAALAFFQLFAKEYLRFSRYPRFVRIVLKINIFGLPALSLFDMIVGLFFLEVLLSILILETLLFLLAASLTGCFRKDARSLFFTISFLIFLIGAGFSHLHTIGIYIPVKTYLFSIGEQIGLVISQVLMAIGITDMINRIRKENEKNQLERIGERAEQKKLHELISAKQEFYADITHEFKTPLNIISGILDGVKNGNYGRAIKPGDELFKILDRTFYKLDRLVNDILNNSALKADILKHSAGVLNIGILLKEIFENFKPRAKSKGLEFTFEDKTETSCYMIC